MNDTKYNIGKFIVSRITYTIFVLIYCAAFGAASYFLFNAAIKDELAQLGNNYIVLFFVLSFCGFEIFTLLLKYFYARLSSLSCMIGCSIFFMSNLSDDSIYKLIIGIAVIISTFTFFAGNTK